ncbi:ABC transporter ATP-binding protein [Vulgatibacter sp.]|uniref:ABC transporter ATP-binding protein n=1 Tax=Vulgatibacter sp. TaxID=1971226 RepID=UPI0035614E6B
MIEVSHLSKRYRDLVAIEDLSFTVEKGEILGFLGPNGAGKSTTMRILTGFQPATSGTARVAGYDVFEQPLEVKRRVGYLPEIPPVYGDMTVAAYLKFVAELKGVPRKARAAEVERVADAARVAHVMDRLIDNVSKGYKQRVGIAQALLGSPDVLVLDEPTVGLDPSQILEVRDLIRGLAGRHTVILSTHILQEVVATCDRVLIIARGKRVAHERLADLQAKHPGKSLDEIFLDLTSDTRIAPPAAVPAAGERAA